MVEVTLPKNSRVTIGRTCHGYMAAVIGPDSGATLIYADPRAAHPVRATRHRPEEDRVEGACVLRAAG
jgi:hypothetical protein